MIYLDNAATSYPKPRRVYEEMLWCMESIVQTLAEGT